MCRFTKEKQKEARHSYTIQRFNEKLPNAEVPGFVETLLSAAEEFKRIAIMLIQISAISLGK